MSRGVVVDAYAQLGAEGYLVARQGGPTRVSGVASPAAGAAPAAPAERPPRFDFRPGAPDVSLFPRAAWLASLRRALRDAPDVRLDYGDPRGAPELRAALARYLGRVRGVAGDPDRIVVTSGMAQGMALVARALVAQGSRAHRASRTRRARPAATQLAANGLELAADAGRRRRPARRRARAAAPRTRSSPRRPTSSRSAWCSPRSGAPR